jgi:hypothetical protein
MNLEADLAGEAVSTSLARQVSFRPAEAARPGCNGTFKGWACLGQVEVVSSAPGKLILAGGGISGCLQAIRPRPTIILVVHCAESLAMCDRVVQVDPAVSAGADREPPASRRVSAR